MADTGLSLIREGETTIEKQTIASNIDGINSVASLHIDDSIIMTASGESMLILSFHQRMLTTGHLPEMLNLYSRWKDLELNKCLHYLPLMMNSVVIQHIQFYIKPDKIIFFGEDSGLQITPFYQTSSSSTSKGAVMSFTIREKSWQAAITISNN